MVESLFRRLGIRPLINAAATQTPIGGSRMNLNVCQAMQEASQYFVDLRALHRAAGGRIAELTHNEDAMISGGVASAFFLVTLALLRIQDPDAFNAYPEKMPSNYSVLIYQTQCVEYTIGIEQTGVRLRKMDENGTVDVSAAMLEREIQKEKPLAFFYVLAGQWIKPGAPSLETAMEVCKRYGVPVIVDGAAQLPPKSNLWRFTQMGADLALFSGGKDLCGPSNIGLVLGKHELIDVCRSLISPNEGVGRFFKVGKEDIVAAVVAVEDYMNRDEEERLRWCEVEVAKMIQGLQSVPGIRAERAFPNEAGQPVPRVFVAVGGASPEQIDKLYADFLQGDPSLAVLADSAKGGFYLNPMTLAEGESDVIVRIVTEYFQQRNL